MATVRHQVAEHDVVALREAVDAWPAGTSGTVVSDYGETKLIEISDDSGATLDLIQGRARQARRHLARRSALAAPCPPIPTSRRQKSTRTIR